MADNHGIFQSNFSFLQKEFPLLANLASAAEYYLHSDPAVSMIKLRTLIEKMVDYAVEIHRIADGYDTSLNTRLKNLEYENLIPGIIAQLLHGIKKKGNLAAHEGRGSKEDARSALFSGFKVAKWFYQTYSEAGHDISHLKFSMPPDLDARHALHLLEQDFDELNQRYAELLEEKEANPLNQEQTEAIQQKSEKSAANIDLDEAETRELLIDVQLRKAGWIADTKKYNYKLHKTKPGKGRFMAIAEWPVAGKWADYALFAGTRLIGIVEAKKYAHDILDRFRNPFIRHELSSIALNAISKVSVRILPTMEDYIKTHEKFPKRLVFTLAATLYFYKGTVNGKEMPLNDDEDTIEFFKNQWGLLDKGEIHLDQLVENALSNETLWGRNLNSIKGLHEQVVKDLKTLVDQSMEKALA